MDLVLLLDFSTHIKSALVAILYPRVFYVLKGNFKQFFLSTFQLFSNENISMNVESNTTHT